MLDNNPFSGGGVGAATKYNPHLWGPEELKAIFVVRQNELARLSDAVKAIEPGEVPQHMLLIGQRGMGKTTLLQRLALEVEEDEALNQTWLPLRFPEEQYTVSTLGELWANVLSSLADAMEARGKDTTIIDEQLLALDTLPDDEKETRTMTLINRWCDHNKQRLLLLIDSTDLMFDNLGSSKKARKGKDDSNLWRLRKTLQHNPNLMWIGGSYKALEANDLYHDAFLDFFDPIHLKPLTLEEITTAMLAMARTFGTGRGITGEQAEQEITRALTARPERLKTLRHLTGGIPRTTVMLYELFAAGGTDEVKADLARLLDMMTPLYKAKLEALPDQQRKLLAHIMEYWQPMPMGELAKASGLINTQISPQLQRLEKEGLIEKTELPNTSRAGYQVAERFFNIWYLMRNAPRRLKLRLAWLIEFMRLWYNPGELESLARNRMQRFGSTYGDLDDLEYSRAIASAMPCENPTRMALDYQVFRGLKSHSQQLDQYFDFDGEDKPFESADKYEKRVDALRDKLMALSFEDNIEDTTEFCELTLIDHGYSIDEKEQMVEQFDTEKYEAIKAELQYRFEGFDIDSLSRFKRMVIQHHFYVDLPNQALADIQLETLANSLPAFYWILAKKYVDKNLAAPKPEPILQCLSFGPQQLIYDNVRYFSALMETFITHTEIKSSLYLWATTWHQLDNASVLNDLAITFDDFGFYDEAENMYKKSISLDPDSASTWYNLAFLYHLRTRNYEDAAFAYRRSGELNSDDPAPYHNLGNLYQDKLQKFDEAEKAYMRAIKIDNRSKHSWLCLGNLYQDHLRQFDSAERAYLKEIELGGSTVDSWNNLGCLYMYNLKQHNKAKWAFEKAIKLDPSTPFPLLNLARLHSLRKQNTLAKASFRALIKQPNFAMENSLALQCHLYLDNQDSANDALNRLAADASTGDNWDFFLVKEQCWESQQMNKGLALAELMAENQYAEFLRPFELALRKVNGDEESIKGAPVEVQELAEEIVKDIELRLPKVDS